MNENIKRKLYKVLKDISLEILHKDNTTNDYQDINDIFLLAETIEHIEQIRPILEKELDNLRKAKIEERS